MSGKTFVRNTRQVWNLYVKTKELGVTPSNYLRVDEHVKRTYGLDGWWTCLQVDDAIFSVGAYIENKTTGLDKNNKPKPSINEYFKKLDAKTVKHSEQKHVTRLIKGSIGGTAPKLKRAS